jgi:hypothetical protein
MHQSVVVFFLFVHQTCNLDILSFSPSLLSIPSFHMKSTSEHHLSTHVLHWHGVAEFPYGHEKVVSNYVTCPGNFMGSNQI